jgi:lipoate-protein ligase B
MARPGGPVPPDTMDAVSRSSPFPSRDELWVAHLGRVPYDHGVALQERARAARQAGEIPDALLLLEHPPVYTKGRRTQPADLPMGEEWYLAQGVDVRPTDRGGRVTYHGPGQLVGYPIMAIVDVLEYVRAMERAVIAALADEGVPARVREGLTGVWAGERKIGSIGVHVARGVSTHGFAVNVDCDLQPFEWIVPCGIDGVRMTSVHVETRRTGAMACFRKSMAWRFAEEFGLRQRLVSLERILGQGTTEGRPSAPAWQGPAAPARGTAGVGA